ncbi:hypothetical protein BH09MYX1_BH09MYX1_67000 [soil metagenome]
MFGRMSSSVHGSCCVCRESDARALTTTRLANGEIAVVCGTHELMHRRMSTPANSATELRGTLRQRRNTARRGEGGDELGMKLSDAFSNLERRRTGTDRRG